MRELTLKYLAPIPVGHRARVVTVLRTTRPLFGEGQKEPLAEPLVVDLDTGVVYGRSGTTTLLAPTAPLSFTSEGLSFGEAIEGRVTACFVGSSPGDAEDALTTRLWLA